VDEIRAGTLCLSHQLDFIIMKADSISPVYFVFKKGFSSIYNLTKFG
jgi:hypothetical protein